MFFEYNSRNIFFLNENVWKFFRLLLLLLSRKHLHMLRTMNLEEYSFLVLHFTNAKLLNWIVILLLVIGLSSLFAHKFQDQVVIGLLNQLRRFPTQTIRHKLLLQTLLWNGQKLKMAYWAH